MLKGVAKQSFTNNDAQELIIEWTATQNKAGNYSTVNATLYIYGAKYYSKMRTGSTEKYCSITINGVKSPVRQHRINVEPQEKMALMSHSMKIEHNSKGEASFKIQAALDAYVDWNGRYESKWVMSERWFTLDTIARGSTLSLNSSSVNYGDRLRFKINASDSSFRHIVKLNVAGFNGTIMSDQTAGDKSYETKREWMSALSNSTRTNGTVTLDTYSGNSRIDSKNYNVEFRIPNDVSPTFSSLAHSEANSTVSSVLGSNSGTYLSGLSKIKFNIDATGGYNSSIKSVSVYVGSYSINGDTFDLSQYKTLRGNVAYQVKAIDSRSREIISKGTINIESYSPPKIQGFQAFRNSSGGIDIKRNGWVSEIRVGGYDRNSMTTRLYLKSSSSSYWQEQGSASSSFSNTSIGRIDKGASYQVKTTITDKFMTVESIVTVSTERALLNLHKEKGIGVGKMHEKGVLDVDGDIYMAGRLFCETATFTEGVMPVSAGSRKDVNTCTKSLRYSFDVGDYQNAINLPVSRPGILDVSQITNGVITQTYTTIEPRNKIFTRSSSYGSWGDWIMVAGTLYEKLPPITSAYTPYATSTNENIPHAVRSGGMVSVLGAYRAARNIGANEEIEVARLPLYMRPEHSIIVRQQASGKNTIMVEVTYDGVIKISRHLGEKGDPLQRIGSGDWVNIGCTFPARLDGVNKYES